jgi:hypothetical protein
MLMIHLAALSLCFGAHHGELRRIVLEVLRLKLYTE